MKNSKKKLDQDDVEDILSDMMEDPMEMITNKFHRYRTPRSNERTAYRKGHAASVGAGAGAGAGGLELEMKMKNRKEKRNKTRCHNVEDNLSKIMEERMEMLMNKKFGRPWTPGHNKGAAYHKGQRASARASNDRFTNLPEDVLVNILERVDTLDAVRACILSKRMLNLPNILSRLDFNVSSIARHHDAATYGFTVRDVVRFNDAVAGVTEKILSARNPEIPICKLRVRFTLRRYDCLSISKAVARAMATQKVDSSEYDILTEKNEDDCTNADFLYFAKQFNNCLRDCPDAFAGLTRLWLRNMRFGELDIPNILSNCKRLEFLRLSCCDAGVHSVVQVEHAQLVELHIEDGEFESFELTCLPKLQRVTYDNWISYEDPMSFGSVPQLSELSLCNTGVSDTKNLQLSQLLANAPSVGTLHLDFESEKVWVLPEHPKLLMPLLSKLRLVNLLNLPEGCDIAWTMFILEAAPSLEELSITVWDHFCDMVTDEEDREEYGYCEKANVEWQPSASDFRHKNLAKLTIYGFQPEDSFVQYVRRVMEAALNIQEISLHDREVYECCKDLDSEIEVVPSRYPRTVEEKDLLRGEITKELEIASPDVIIHFRS